jgi:hypothetical protein
MFVMLLIISAVVLVFSFIGLGIRIILRSYGRFPEIHVGRNKEMKKLGISCARDIDIGCSLEGDPDVCVTCGAKRI